ncbi:MAG: Crp/Fnr family transcriptional regulator [candidate division Zixibacteria bacterium]|nr:Crp/Fnr family transcriptional regulator [candidate division Zixibacteria bacterium]MDH3938220.1 Crp/Fnr family transcriptional regulator [candidate division Zixibacteria bacterium]MDH4032916.1 Crp/Fnr family transcriptional regulator [candidate division Zixibacteria bacterium]
MQQILKMSHLFSELEDRSLNEIASASSLKSCDPGDTFFFEGDPVHSFFIVGSGRVKVFKLSPDGKEQILMVAEPGDSFAEAAMFAGGRYPASATALERSEVLVVNRERFVGILQREPGLALNMIARLSELLRSLTKLVEGLSLTDVTTRLAKHLLDLIPDTDSNEATVTLNEKKTILASKLGTIPETLSRSLARLSREKIIAVEGATIRILDRQRLQQLVEGNSTGVHP